MLVNTDVLEDLYNSAGLERKEKALDYRLNGKVHIAKVTYDNPENLELYSTVDSLYHVYIRIAGSELEDVRCECTDYQKHYGACEHIVATMMEFTSNQEYIRLFSEQGTLNMRNNLVTKQNKEQEQYRVFKQMLNTFYHQQSGESENNQLNVIPLHSVRIEPKVIYNAYTKSMKIELKIGSKQLYKLKDLPSFYERMLKQESYRYGAKLEFVHTEEAFEENNLPLLRYVLKYAEIIKYTNEAMNNYGHYGRTMGDDYITISNSGMDELFEALKGKCVEFQKEVVSTNVYFEEAEPNIQFDIQKVDDDTYEIVPHEFDVYEYEIIEGKDYLYFLYHDVLYRCQKDFEDTVLKLLEVFRNNYTSQIKFPKKDLSKVFSVVYPKLKENIGLGELDEKEVNQYVPKELFVKVFLDVTEENYITAEVKFIYGDTEFNPFLPKEVSIPRDIVRENEVLEIFLKTGFMLDRANARLILVNEEQIYSFLSTEIEIYMQQFEVLATDTFKKREIREPKIGNLGVRIENNLLHIDFSQMDFDLTELKDIMKKYRLKKKYHRLKDGSFLKLEENDTMNFIESVTDAIDIDYTQVQRGELHLPLYRSMYLDRLLQNMNSSGVSKSAEYKQLVKNMDKKEVDEEIPIPEGLHADLRSYQKIGFQWLALLDKYQLGGILADDMGLGKTVQMLAVVLSYVENTEKAKPTMVVCPSSLALNWYNEIQKFAPSLKAIVIHGSVEERETQIKEINQYHVVITSYDLLKRDIDLYRELNYQFKYVIADEAQYIKNNNTQNARAIKAIQSDTRYALTGTPIENSLSELWSIFDFIMPGYLFRYKKFKELYENSIAKENDESCMSKLKMLIEPFILRRIKKEVLTELPDKTITVLHNEMQGEQLKLYASYIAQAKKEAVREIHENGFEKSQIKILALLMRLRQICCHPALFLQNYHGESSKLTQCVEVVKEAIQAGHKILLFSGYTSMFEILEKELKKEGISYFKLTGQTKVGDRIRLVDEFNENDDIKVFLISLKAGGTGLNLIGADMVIHYDPWWNISSENQATDRTYRIGQKRNVQVYKLITKNSIEEKIYELQQKKAKLADTMLSTEQTFINRLSKEDIMALFE